ncbi:MAG: tRNA (adenosine(37)-N6)-threonylcarbamoyltransferase complex ATPase subunit type 1 TsaE [Sulfurospirillum sp.]
MNEKVCTLDELESFAKEIAELAKDCGVVLLRGDLASGKTTFVKKFSSALGLREDVVSPTFSVQNRYGESLYHYDIYQNGIGGFLSSGLLEELDKEGYHLIEWGDEKLESVLRKYFIDYIVVDIEKKSDESRVYKVKKCIN